MQTQDLWYVDLKYKVWVQVDKLNGQRQKKNQLNLISRKSKWKISKNKRIGLDFRKAFTMSMMSLCHWVALCVCVCVCVMLWTLSSQVNEHHPPVKFVQLHFNNRLRSRLCPSSWTSSLHASFDSCEPIHSKRCVQPAIRLINYRTKSHSLSASIALLLFYLKMFAACFGSVCSVNAKSTCFVNTPKAIAIVFRHIQI